MYQRKSVAGFRRGAATVELAVCLPVIAIIVLGSLSATSMIFVRTAIVQSAYEAIREVVKADGDIDLARERAQDVLTFRNIQAESIEFDPANVADQDPGTPITVTVIATADTNGLFQFGPFRDQRIQVQSVMLKE